MDYYNHFCHLLSDIDEGLLLAVNGYHTQFLDEAMWTISDRWTWVPMYFLLLLTVVRKTGFKKGAFVILFVTALIIATDQTCASFIRPLVGRLRPSNPDNPVSELIITVNGYRGGRYGFPSCHAANTFALAIYLSLLLKNRYVTISMVTWSLLVSFSRIYLGVHYPGDILGGMAVGALLACIYYQPLRWYDRIVPHETPQFHNHSMPAVRKRFRLISSIKALAIGIIILKPAAGIAQSDTIDCHAIPTERTEPYKFKPLQLLIPATLIGVGIIGLESDWLKWHNRETRDELQENLHSKLSVDDFTQFAPLAAAYGLKLCGVKALHGYGDMTIIASTAYILTSISVYGLKTVTKVERPDGSSRNSFPSGHTATAFAGAELLRREYRHTSPWIGVAGYVVAAGTGFLRMYNNRHWLTDVIAGAGIGILSAQAAYWLYPVITKTFFRRHYNSIFVSPTLSTAHIGLSAHITF